MNPDDEIFHTFNALHESHKQIVLTPDRKHAGDLAASYATVEGAVVHEMIEHTMFSICNDETRFHLNGAYFESDSSKCRMVSTDGHPLSRSSAQASGDRRRPGSSASRAP